MIAILLTDPVVAVVVESPLHMSDMNDNDESGLRDAARISSLAIVAASKPWSEANARHQTDSRASSMLVPRDVRVHMYT